ncbi:hypothetical protein HDU97_004524 [Phlyctochytrium planicorne]|nr:hypothetical protein HDU97_004524 [Phlyctochytrium planicorne]
MEPGRSTPAVLSRVLVTLLLLLCSPQSAFGQISCFSLSASSMCGSDFDGYPILYDPANLKGFANEDAMSSFLSVNVSSPSDLASRLALTHGCDPDTAESKVDILRYQVSLWCARFVWDATAAGCGVPSNGHPHGPLLCGAQCSLAVSTFSNLVTDPDACPLSLATNDQKAHRTGVISTFQTYCSNFSNALSSNGNYCSSGAPSDSRQCGFRTAAIEVSSCPSLASSTGDKCCSDFLEAATATSSTSEAPKSTSTPSKPAPTTAVTSKAPRPSTSGLSTAQNTTDPLTASSSSSTGSSSSLTLVSIVGVALTVIVIGVTATALVIMRNRRMNGGNRRSQQNMFSSNASMPKPPDTFRVITTSTSQSAIPMSPDDFKKVPEDFNKKPDDAFSFRNTPSSYGSTAPILASQNRMRSESGASASSHYSLSPQPLPSPRTPNSATPLVQPTPQLPSTNNPAPPRTSTYHAQTMPTAATFNPNRNTRASTRSAMQSMATDAPAPLIMTVLHSYQPVLADELELQAGQDIIVLNCFDDGWGLGMLPSTGGQGAFPLICVLATTPSELSSATPSPRPVSNHPHMSLKLPTNPESKQSIYGNLPSASMNPHVSMIGDHQAAAQQRLSMMMRQSGISDVGFRQGPLRRVSSKRGTSQYQ